MKLAWKFLCAWLHNRSSERDCLFRALLCQEVSRRCSFLAGCRDAKSIFRSIPVLKRHVSAESECRRRGRFRGVILLPWGAGRKLRLDTLWMQPRQT